MEECDPREPFANDERLAALVEKPCGRLELNDVFVVDGFAVDAFVAGALCLNPCLRGALARLRGVGCLDDEL